MKNFKFIILLFVFLKINIGMAQKLSYMKEVDCELVHPSFYYNPDSLTKEFKDYENYIDSLNSIIEGVKYTIHFNYFHFLKTENPFGIIFKKEKNRIDGILIYLKNEKYTYIDISNVTDSNTFNRIYKLTMELKPRFNHGGGTFKVNYPFYIETEEKYGFVNYELLSSKTLDVDEARNEIITFLFKMKDTLKDKYITP